MASTLDSKSPNNRRRTLLLRTAGVVVVVLVLTGVGLIGWLVVTLIVDDKDHDRAGQVSLAFEQALEVCRLAEAYSLTTRKYQARVSYEEFKEMIDRHPAVKVPPEDHWRKDEKLTGHKFGSREFAYQTDVFIKGKSASFSYTVVMEEGRGRIDSITFR